jgi:hypothetical protein
MLAAARNAATECAGSAPSFWMDGAAGVTTGAGQHDGFAVVFPAAPCLATGAQ